MAKNKGLGRGLDDLLVDNFFPGDEKESGSKITVSLSEIDTKPDQPRKNFDAESIAALADSIAANGLLQPILVRKIGDRYEIIAGERRFRASKMAGLTEIPVIITEADDLTAAKYALIENLQREDLNPYEEAKAYKVLIDEYDLSHEEVSVQIGKSRSAITNALRLLELPEEAVAMLVDGTLAAGHGRALLGLRDKTAIVPLAERIAAKGMSVREAEEAVKKANKAYKAALKEDNNADKPVEVNYIETLEARFTDFTGRKCKITDTKNKKTFRVEYRDAEDLEDIMKKLAGAGIFEGY